MKKFLRNLLAVVLLAGFAFAVYRLPSMMLTEATLPSSPPQATGGSLLLAEGITPKISPSATGGSLLLAEEIVVTASTVNIRELDGSATGYYARNGDKMTVQWINSEWGKIIKPDSLRGMTIWRGCTSAAGNLGCQSK